MSERPIALLALGRTLDARALAGLDALLAAEGVDAVLISGAGLSVSIAHGVSVGRRPIDASSGAFGGAPSEPVGAEPLILVPGTGCDHDLWTEVMAAVADRANPIPVRIDLDSSISGMAETILASAPDRFALAGHSQGAIVCLEIIRQAPERVLRLALINAGGRAGDESQLATWSELRRRLESGRDGAVVADLVAASLNPAVSAVTGERMTAMAERVGRGGLLRQLTAQSGRADSRPGLAAISCPTLVIAGDQDRVCPLELPRELAGSIPNARLEVIKGCGHLAPLERPREMSDLLRVWLAESVGVARALPRS